MRFKTVKAVPHKAPDARKQGVFFPKLFTNCRIARAEGKMADAFAKECMGSMKAAARKLKSAAEIYRRLGMAKEEAEACREVAYASRNVEEKARYLMRASDAFMKIGMEGDAADCDLAAQYVQEKPR